MIHFVKNTKSKGDKHVVSEARVLSQETEDWCILDDHKKVVPKEVAEGDSDSAYVLCYAKETEKEIFYKDGKKTGHVGLTDW